MIRIPDEEGGLLEEALQRFAINAEYDGRFGTARQAAGLRDMIRAKRATPDHDTTVLGRIYELLSGALVRNRFSTGDLIHDLRNAVFSPSELRRLEFEKHLSCIKCQEKIHEGELCTFSVSDRNTGALLCARCCEPTVCKCPRCKASKSIQLAVKKMLSRVRLTCECRMKGDDELLAAKQAAEDAVQRTAVAGWRPAPIPVAPRRDPPRQGGVAPAPPTFRATGHTVVGRAAVGGGNAPAAVDNPFADLRATTPTEAAEVAPPTQNNQGAGNPGWPPPPRQMTDDQVLAQLRAQLNATPATPAQPTARVTLDGRPWTTGT